MKRIGICKWLLVTGYWLLVTGYWLLVTGYGLLVTGYGLLDPCYCAATIVVQDDKRVTGDR